MVAGMRVMCGPVPFAHCWIFSKLPLQSRVCLSSFIGQHTRAEESKLVSQAARWVCGKRTASGMHALSLA